MVAIAGTGWVLAPSLVAYVHEADRYYPQRDRTSDGSIGDLAHQARVSDHNPVDGYVHAVDLDEDLAPGLDLKWFAEKLRLRRDTRIKYVIYEGRMFASYLSPNGPAWQWRPYDGVNAHEHHLHLSILHTDAARTSTAAWGFAPAAAITPSEDDDMPLIIKANDRVARLLDAPVFAPLDSASYKALKAAGIKEAVVTQSDYDDIRGQVLDALGRAG